MNTQKIDQGRLGIVIFLSVSFVGILAGVLTKAFGFSAQAAEHVGAAAVGACPVVVIGLAYRQVARGRFRWLHKSNPPVA